MKKWIQVLLLVLVGAFQLGCGREMDAKAFVKAIEASSGDNYSIEKMYTAIEGYVVLKNERTGEYTAYNLNKFDRKNKMSFESYLAAATSPSDIVSGLSRRVEQKWVTEYQARTRTTVDYRYEYDYDTGDYEWVPYEESETYYVPVEVLRTYVFFDGVANGSQYTFENGSGLSKDLESIGAIAEGASREIIQSALQGQFGMSAERSEELARLALRMKNLQKKRALTTEDLEALSVEALGSKASEVEKAMLQKAAGNQAPMNSLIEKAAQVNEVSPEQMKSLLNVVLGQ